LSSQWVVVVNPFLICLFENEGTEEPCPLRFPPLYDPLSCPFLLLPLPPLRSPLPSPFLPHSPCCFLVRHIFGLKNGVKGNIHFTDETHLLYPAGSGSPSFHMRNAPPVLHRTSPLAALYSRCPRTFEMLTTHWTRCKRSFLSSSSKAQHNSLPCGSKNVALARNLDWRSFLVLVVCRAAVENRIGYWFQHSLSWREGLLLSYAVQEAQSVVA
jgi:hypothetical protein